MKIDLDDNMQHTVTQSIAIVGIIIIAVVALKVLGMEGKEIGLSLGSALGGFLGGMKLANPKQPPEKPQSPTMR